MTYETWMSETSRGVFTPRSAALGAVDAAFSNCKDSMKASLPLRKTLFDKLELWVKAQENKGKNWKSSTRNATKDNKGRGTVERLFADFAADPIFKPQVAKLNALPVAPAPALGGAYVPGKWDHHKDQDGGWHEFIRQQKGNSCVPSTIVMVKRAFHGLSAGQLSEEQIRGVMGLEESGNLNQGLSSLSHTAQSTHDWANQGTGPDHAVNVLRANPYPVPGARKLSVRGQGLRTDLRKCSSKKPGLIGWLWVAGGGHFTVCCGPTKDDSKLIILDPWNGIQYVPNVDPHFASYLGATARLGDAIVCG